jgi:hypothetical protein
VCPVLSGCRVVMVVEFCQQGREVGVDGCRCREVEGFEFRGWVVLGSLKDS